MMLISGYLKEKKSGIDILGRWLVQVNRSKSFAEKGSTGKLDYVFVTLLVIFEVSSNSNTVCRLPEACQTFRPRVVPILYRKVLI